MGWLCWCGVAGHTRGKREAAWPKKLSWKMATNSGAGKEWREGSAFGVHRHLLLPSENDNCLYNLPEKKKNPASKECIPLCSALASDQLSNWISWFVFYPLICTCSSSTNPASCVFWSMVVFGQPNTWGVGLNRATKVLLTTKENFSHLLHLERIKTSNNYLTGSVPESGINLLISVLARKGMSIFPKMRNVFFHVRCGCVNMNHCRESWETHWE